MYEGYLEFGGVPIINAEATEAYVRNLAPNISLRPRFNSETIHIANEEPAYRSPMLDEAQWANRLDRATQEFYGMYPVSIEGMDDSTLSAEVVEYLSAGGTPLSGREGTRSIRVSGMLVAASKLGAQAGLTWLRAAMRDDGCETCNGSQLRYFLSDPQVCEIAWGDVVQAKRKPFGQVGQETLNYRFQIADGVDPRMPAHVTWNGSFLPGTVIEYGALNLSTAVPKQVYGPIALTRKNFLPNPTMRRDLTGWSITGSGSGIWTNAGGVDGDSYLQLIPTVNLSGASKNYGAGNYGAGTYGGNAGIEMASTTTAEVVPAGPVIFGVALRALKGGTADVKVTNLNGTVIARETIALSSSWIRYTLDGTLAADSKVVVSVTCTDTAVDVDQASLEATGFDLGSYFDGETIEQDFTNQWTGAVDNSSSTSTWIAKPVIDWPDSNFRPYLKIISGGATALELNWDILEARDVGTQLLPYERFFYDVACTQGPQVTATYDLGNHGYFIAVDMEFVAGNPYAYSAEVGVDIEAVTTGAYVDPQTIPELDDQWLIDPDCLAPTAPVQPPAIQNLCIANDITTWQRYYVSIPGNQIADWAATVPVITINSLGDDVRQVRVRFHPNPFKYDVQRVDPTAYCSEFVLSYLPGSATLKVDGIARQVTASKSGKATVNANHLLFGSSGGPVTWPDLSCAIDYVMTLDVPSPADRDLFDIELALALKE